MLTAQFDFSTKHASFLQVSACGEEHMSGGDGFGSDYKNT